MDDASENKLDKMRDTVPAFYACTAWETKRHLRG